MKNSKIMTELHKIREEMTKMSKSEKEILTKDVRKRYRNLIVK